MFNDKFLLTQAVLREERNPYVWVYDFELVN